MSTVLGSDFRLSIREDEMDLYAPPTLFENYGIEWQAASSETSNFHGAKADLGNESDVYEWAFR